MSATKTAKGKDKPAKLKAEKPVKPVGLEPGEIMSGDGSVLVPEGEMTDTAGTDTTDTAGTDAAGTDTTDTAGTDTTDTAGLLMKAEKPAEPVVVRDPIHIQFLKQYIEMARVPNHAIGIQSLKSFCAKLLASKNEADFDSSLELIRANRELFAKHVALRCANSLSIQDQAKLEYVVPVLANIANDVDMSTRISIDKVREYTKSDTFANWLAKRFAR